MLMSQFHCRSLVGHSVGNAAEYVLFALGDVHLVGKFSQRSLDRPTPENRSRIGSCVNSPYKIRKGIILVNISQIAGSKNPLSDHGF